jgi:hypothetical protein
MKIAPFPAVSINGGGTMKKIILVFICICSFLCINSSVYATTIFYDLDNLGGNQWQYTYTVSNDSLATPIEEFSIYFDYGLYDNLTVTSSLINWSELAVSPQLILGVPQDGFYDALTLLAGIAPGDIESGFSVSFDWLGSRNPGAQYFDVVYPNDFSVIDSGQTERASVPEPGTFMLLSSGVFITFILRNRFKKQNKQL